MLIFSAVLINIILLGVEHSKAEDIDRLGISIFCVIIIFLFDALVNRFIINAGNTEEQFVFLSPPRAIAQVSVIFGLVTNAINKYSWFRRESYAGDDYFWLTAISLFIAAASYVIVKIIPFKKNIIKKFDIGLFCVLVCLVFYFAGEYTWIPSNIMLFGLGVYYIIIGGKNLKLGQLNLGMFMVMYIIILRFFDLDLGLLERGIAFIIIGIAFFICNILVFKKKKGKLFPDKLSLSGNSDCKCLSGK